MQVDELPDKSLLLDVQNPSNIGDVYKEFSSNARAYMDLKFKHFATFSVLTTFLGTAAYQNKSAPGAVFGISVLGVTESILFWILEHRTGQYLRYFLKQTKAFEARFIPLHLRGELVPPVPSPRLLGASRVTNLIFAIILVAWLLLPFLSLLEKPAAIPSIAIPKNDNQHHLLPMEE
jgi:hypothetical protein